MGVRGTAREEGYGCEGGASSDQTLSSVRAQHMDERRRDTRHDTAQHSTGQTTRNDPQGRYRTLQAEHQ